MLQRVRPALLPQSCYEMTAEDETVRAHADLNRVTGMCREDGAEQTQPERKRKRCRVTQNRQR